LKIIISGTLLKMTTKVQFVPYHWENYTLSRTDNEVIAYAFLKNEERCLIRVQNFQPWVYLKLPVTRQFEFLDWRNQKVQQSVIKAINYRLNRKNPSLTVKRVVYEEKYDVNHYSEHKSPMYRLHFSNFYGRKEILTQFNYSSKEPATLTFFYKNRKHSFTPDFGDAMVEVYNQMLMTNNSTTTAWLEGNFVVVPPEQQISTFSHEYIVKYSKDMLTQVPDEVADSLPYHPLVLAFDIETRTPNYKRMPVKYWDEHHIFMISADSKRAGTKDKITRKVFLYGDAHDFDQTKLNKEARRLFGTDTTNVEIIRCPSEQVLLELYFDYLTLLDPDILTGYNIHGYDMPYIHERMIKYGIPYPQACSRLKYVKPRFNDFSWSSSAHTKVVLDKIEMSGRVYIDLYSVAYKDYKGKLPKFNLDTVLKVLLGKNKFSPVSYEDLFRAFDAQDHPRKLINKCVKKWVAYEDLTAAEIKKFETTYPDFTSAYRFVPIFHDNIHSDVVVELFRQHEVAKENMKDAVIYSDYDSFACIELFEFLSAAIVTKELAGISRVNPADIYSRGEQHKGVALIANDAYHHDYVLFRDLSYSNLNSKGGFVGDMTVGLTDDTICLDFNSLYPIEMMVNNICYSTLVRENEKHLHNRDDPNDVIPIHCPEERKRKDDKGKEVIDVIHHEFWFSQKRRGLIPELQEHLISKRKIMKKLMEQYAGTPLEAVYNARQLGLKISGNSLYGMATIGEKGKLPCKPVGMATASKGRDHILQSNDMIRAEGGAVVYNDTDSTIFTMPGVTGKDCIIVGRQLEKKFSAMFPGKLYFEFEKAGKFFGYTKKRYIIWKYISKETDPHFGELYPIDHKDALIIRGILIARKDNAKLQRDLFSDVLFGILQKRNYQDTIGVVFKTFAKLICGHIPWNHLLIIKGVGASYTSETAMMKIFKDKCELDGNPIQAGEKVDYIVVDTPTPKGQKKKTVGEKACLPKVYVRKQEEGLNPKPDVLYYMNNALLPSVEQTIEIGFHDMIQKSMTKQRREHIAAIFHALEQQLGLRFIEKYAHITDDIEAYEKMIDEYLSVKGDDLIDKKQTNKRFAKEYNAVRTLNIKYFTSTNLLNHRPNATPLRYFIRAYKQDLKNSDSEFSVLHRYLRATCTPSDYKEIAHIFKSPRGTWAFEADDDDELDDDDVD